MAIPPRHHARRPCAGRNPWHQGRNRSPDPLPRSPAQCGTPRRTSSGRSLRRDAWVQRRVFRARRCRHQLPPARHRRRRVCHRRPRSCPSRHRLRRSSARGETLQASQADSPKSLSTAYRGLSVSRIRNDWARADACQSPVSLAARFSLKAATASRRSPK